MSNIYLRQHYKEDSHSQPQFNDQYLHPSTLMRWIIFLIPLVYYLIIKYYKNQAYCISFKHQHMKNQILSINNINYRNQSGLIDLLIILIGIYIAIVDGWSIQQWVLWSFLLISSGLMLLFSHSKIDGIAIIAFLFSIISIIAVQWLFIVTANMVGLKTIVRIIIGANVATMLHNFIVRLCKIISHFCKLSLNVYLILVFFMYFSAGVGFIITDIHLYGPFIDVLGFIVIWLFLSVNLIYLYMTNQL